MVVGRVQRGGAGAVLGLWQLAGSCPGFCGMQGSHCKENSGVVRWRAGEPPGRQGG